MHEPKIEMSRAPEARMATIEEAVKRRPEIAGFQSYESFGNNSAQQKEAFMRGEDVAFSYPRLHEAGVNELIGTAHAAEKGLVVLAGSEKGDRVEALYNAIEYRQSEMFLVSMAARINDASLSAEQRAEAAEWFKEANENLYGVPENKVFAAIARERLLAHLDEPHKDENLARVQEELKVLVGHIHDEGYELAKIAPESKDRFENLVRERFGGMVDHIQPRYVEDVDGKQVEQKYEVPEIIEAITVALEKIGAVEMGWRCEEVEGESLISVSAHEKLVKVGVARQPISAGVLQGKVVHEVGVHVLRSVNAERAGWTSAAYGQDGYLDFEEAFASAAGAAFWGEKPAPGAEYRYLLAGLAYGLDDHGPRDMRECYEIMWRVVLLDRKDRKKRVDEEKAKNEAFLQCVRLFRGTPTNIPGLIYTKDLTYINGRERVNPTIELIESQDDIDLFLAGKLDPTLAEHLRIAEDITPGRSIAAKLRKHFALAA